MRNLTFILIVLSFCFSCKKKETVNPEQPVINTVNNKMTFSFSLLEENGEPPISPAADVFTMKILKDNNEVYNLRTTSDKFKVTIPDGYNIATDCSFKFEIASLDDGIYTYEISDSLNAYGFYKDSLVISENVRSQYFDFPLPLGNLGKKPSFTLQNYQVFDTISGIHCIAFKFYTNNAPLGGQLAMFIGKNANVSKTNYLSAFSGLLSNQWFPLYNNYTSNSFVEPQYINETSSLFHSGDSIYFAVYPASGYFTQSSINKCVVPIQYNAISDQKVLIGYKLH